MNQDNITDTVVNILYLYDPTNTEILFCCSEASLMPFYGVHNFVINVHQVETHETQTEILDNKQSLCDIYRLGYCTLNTT